ncbi:WYL domain-containing transcriptional regulator [Mogibacterium sp. NSJ-24]|jgi:predicted DNA-binding transcriptional regulator YafY|uniref:WYL domain-containing transcriptional regulator n=2 Tax=Lentihominibacter hominis TaxID=2763645 RepID=A0A926EAR1_9FIRM|nr:WYL domain-containing protein [Lentihominibacter hominis]MBC8568839.1 WYL domain-containing transcriptional regulator [Lentihominibacter hominis]
MTISRNKLRILYIIKFLLEQTDEDNIMSAEDLINALNRYGIEAERKTIYSDIKVLIEFGIDIISLNGGKTPGYYIGTREFELPELKLLVDAVQASKFITAKKSKELISKIEKLASKNSARQLQRNVFIFNRTKTENERIYYNVDQIHTAVLENRQISFQYTEWNLQKELVTRKNGKIYIVSPWALTWDDENYYLIAFEEESRKIKHYRVDKMKNTEIIEEKRLGKDSFADFDLAFFAKKTFGMYGGRDETVSLVCENRLIGVILDRFSKDVIIIPEDSNHFRVNVLVSVSPQFFGWITGIGAGIHIEGPKVVKEEYRRFIEEILGNYVCK